MSHSTIAALVLATGLSMAATSQATAATYVTTLAGSNEVPPNASPGTGTATLVIVGNNMALSTTFSGLLSPSTIGHIHCCATPTAIPATPVPSFPGFPVGVTSGSYNAVFDLTQASSYNPAFITANGGTTAGAMAAFIAGLNAGNAYLNIHTQQFPGGEIRGNFSLVPEPGTWALMITGFGLAGLAIRRRRAVLAA